MRSEEKLEQTGGADTTREEKIKRLRALINRQEELNVLHKRYIDNRYVVRAETEQDKDSLESPYT